MAYCSACGKKLEESYLFCYSCGKRIKKREDEEIRALEVKTGEAEKEAEKEMSTGKEIALMIVILVIIVLITYAVVVYGDVTKIIEVISRIGTYIKNLF
ncbi:MAG: zinc-ribbon domain-containing protein [Nanoarchaeota archaeon]